MKLRKNAQAPDEGRVIADSLTGGQMKYFNVWLGRDRQPHLRGPFPDEHAAVEDLATVVIGPGTVLAADGDEMRPVLLVTGDGYGVRMVRGQVVV